MLLNFNKTRSYTINEYIAYIILIEINKRKTTFIIKSLSEQLKSVK